MTPDEDAPHHDEAPFRPRWTGEGRLPGDPDPRRRIEEIIRVDQAGEFGATRIYAGQLAVLGRTVSAPVLRHMAEQERVHLETFDRLMAERRVRPTLLSPLWHVAGYALGAGTALLGQRAAMACTVAVEEVIDEHYAAQRDELGDDEENLRDTIERFRAEEVEHRDTGLQREAELTLGYGLLTGAIKTGSRIAIWLSTRF